MELSNICYYVKDKVETSILDSSTYISTENMLPDKGGITISSNIPEGKAIKVLPSDTLISNIRPYFKKIWYSDRYCGCSSDVLCFRCKPNNNSQYLYYLLSQQSFFDYVMSGANGCKMPRGDRNQIMKWEITDFSLDKQNKIASILSSLDAKIENNNKINANLEAQAQALFKSWFVDFEPFQDGEFEDSELGRIPKGWKVGSLFDVALVLDKKRKPLSGNERDKMDKIYPYYGATCQMDFVDDYIFDGIYTLMGEDGSVINENGLPYMQYVWGKMWINNHAHVLQGKNGFTTEMLYAWLSQTNIKHLVTGAVQAKLSQANMQKISLPIAPNHVLYKFSLLVSPLFDIIRTNIDSNKRLSLLRDTLLPKLMSGEIEV